MRKVLEGILMITAVLLGLEACNENEMPGIYKLEGTYKGEFKTGASLNGPFIHEAGITQATAEVSAISDDEIEVHCYGIELDTTIVLSYYQHNDSVMVCATGDDFDHIYGHMPGEGHMSGSGGMMGDKTNNETEWMHHMVDEHANGDEHFGGFDMHDHSFGYTFEMMEGLSVHYLRFEGMKQ